MQFPGIHAWVNDTYYTQLPFPEFLTKEQVLRIQLPRINTDVDRTMMMDEESVLQAPYNGIGDLFQPIGRASTHEQILRACLPRINTDVGDMMMMDPSTEIQVPFSEISDLFQPLGRIPTHEEILRACLPRINTDVGHMMMEEEPEIQAPCSEISDLFQPLGKPPTHEEILRACLPRINTEVGHTVVEDEGELCGTDALLWFESWEHMPEENKWEFIPKKWDVPEETWESKDNEESILSNYLPPALETYELAWDKQELPLPEESVDPGFQLEGFSSFSNGISNTRPDVESSSKEIFVIGEDSAYPGDDEEIEIVTCDTKNVPAVEHIFDYSQPQVYLLMELEW